MRSAVGIPCLQAGEDVKDFICTFLFLSVAESGAYMVTRPKPGAM